MTGGGLRDNWMKDEKMRGWRYGNEWLGGGDGVEG